MTGPSLAEIEAARRRLAPWLTSTPLLHSWWLSAAASTPVHLKVESIQLTHAFKIRGAFNALLKLVERSGARLPTVVTASAGNHGSGVAVAASRLGISAIVFAPRTAPAVKKDAIRRLGATLHETTDYDAAEIEAREYARTQGACYLSPYNNPDVIAGAGTIGLEIVDALPDVTTVVVPIGGGGLASGVAIAVKGKLPHTTVIAVEAEASRAFGTSLARGEITAIQPGRSVADGLTGNLEPGSITFELVRRYVDRVVAVSESELADAIRGLAAEEHLIAEGAGAATTAAILAGRAVGPGDRAAAILSGGNIDLATFTSVVATA
jgi:threonine dehydratase